MSAQKGVAVDNADDHQAKFDSMVSQFPTTPCDPEVLDPEDLVTPHIPSRSYLTSPYKTLFNDPFWKNQWYVQDYRKKDGPVMDHNVVPAYRKGFTGRGVTVAVVDDGILNTHPDLSTNFLYDLSYDFCLKRPGSFPPPEHEIPQGTRVAGVIAMEADNGECGVGIAYEANIVGATVLCSDRDLPGIELAKAMTHKLGQVDIYSMNFGPVDDGRTLEPEDSYVRKALVQGVTRGRGRKGAIYIFASGNGKHNGDNCAADWQVNQVAAITVASASQKGNATYWGERCAGILATAYSSGEGSSSDESVVAPTSLGGCDANLQGSTASGAIAAGIIALVLQAKPELTYRDVKHLIAYSSEVAPLANNLHSWYKNGAGFWVSNDFGFGLLNAENMVDLAQGWQPVPKRKICSDNVELE